MLARDFLRPIAHRGLHDRADGRIENARRAFEAAISAGYGIECDIRHARDGTPIVFHDVTLARLTDHAMAVSDLTPDELGAIRYANGDCIMTLGELLQLVDGQVPLLVEIKSEWQPLPEAFLDRIAAAASGYRGPFALMSFDPVAVSAMRRRAPEVPRGIVSGRYRADEGDGWWKAQLSPERQARLSDLLDSREAAPDFFAYHVKSLPTPVTHFVREVLGMPLFAWTVRTTEDRALAAQFADAPIFEGYRP